MLGVQELGGGLCTLMENQPGLNGLKLVDLRVEYLIDGIKGEALPCVTIIIERLTWAVATVKTN